jgi:hypothetical protein
MLDTVYYLDTRYIAHDVSGTGYIPVRPCISNRGMPHTTDNGNTKQKNFTMHSVPLINEKYQTK